MKTIQFIPYQDVVDSKEQTAVVVRRAFANANKPEQITLQFSQRIKIEGSTTTNVLVAIAQGVENAGTNMATALFSMSKTVWLEKMGLTEFSDVDYYEEASGCPTANSLFGTDVSIEVTDSFKSNPFSSNHKPKINPKTAEVMMIDGKPVYRHTELVSGPAMHRFDPVSSDRAYPRGMDVSNIEPAQEKAVEVANNVVGKVDAERTVAVAQ